MNRRQLVAGLAASGLLPFDPPARAAPEHPKPGGWLAITNCHI